MHFACASYKYRDQALSEVYALCTVHVLDFVNRTRVRTCVYVMSSNIATTASISAENNNTFFFTPRPLRRIRYEPASFLGTLRSINTAITVMYQTVL